MSLRAQGEAISQIALSLVLLVMIKTAGVATRIVECSRLTLRFTHDKIKIHRDTRYNIFEGRDRNLEYFLLAS